MDGFITYLQTTIYILLLVGTYYLGRKITEKEQKSKLKPYIIAKYKGKNIKNVLEDKEYLLKIELSYPQNILATNFVNAELFYYKTLHEFLQDWEPLFDDVDKMGVALSGVFGYDSGEQAYIKNLIDNYFSKHKKEYKQLQDRLRKGAKPPITIKSDYEYLKWR